MIGPGIPGPKGQKGEKGSQYYSEEKMRTMMLTTLQVYVDTKPTKMTNLEESKYRTVCMVGNTIYIFILVIAEPFGILLVQMMCPESE